MSRVRLGAVGYLNAGPLVFGLERSSRFDLRFDVPSKCAELLHEGAIDVGLIPSIEYLRGAGGPSSGPSAYRIVPDLSIASRGEVASVALYTTRPMADVRSIAMDTSSRTSVALVRVLCGRRFRIAPSLEAHGPDLDKMLDRCDAALLIGDNALFRRAEPDSQPSDVRGQPRDAGVPRSFERIDLGEAWTSMTGLSFVWAFWAGRPGAVDAEEVIALQHARDLGVNASEQIAAQYFPESPERRSVGASYLRDNIKYSLGADERAGLELFYRYAAEAGVVSEPRPLQFY